MPYLRLRIAAPQPDNIDAPAIAQTLTQLAVTKLGKNAAAAAVDLKLTDPHTWFIGGQPLTALHQSSFVLEVKVTAGTNTRDEKAAFIKAAYAAMQAQLGALAETSYVIVTDVPGDAWGYGGKTQDFRYLVH